jgi:hypothetical protein
MAVFNKKASKRLSSLLYEARKKIAKDPSKQPPLWIGGNSVPDLRKKWDTPEYRKICAKAKQNRNSDKGSCAHNGGSTSASPARIRFIRKHGRVPTLVEMNNLLHRYNDGTWIKNGSKAQEVAVNIYLFVIKLTFVRIFLKLITFN